MKESTILESKVALVTGAGSGIGRAIALRLSQAGAHVVIGYFGDSSGAKETIDLLSPEASQRAIIVEADIRRRNEVTAMIGHILTMKKRLDIIVCNAALYKNGPFLEVDEETWRTVIDTNLNGTFFCAQETAKIMVKTQTAGHIILIGSTQGQRPIRGTAAYAATKGALRTLTKTMALELAAHQISVNLVSPGVVESASNIDWLADPAVRREVVAAIPMGDIVQPSEVADFVTYLAAHAGTTITGAEFVLDGGLLIEGPQV